MSSAVKCCFEATYYDDMMEFEACPHYAVCLSGCLCHFYLELSTSIDRDIKVFPLRDALLCDVVETTDIFLNTHH